MDVLQLIKEDHAAIRSLMGSVQSSTSMDDLLGGTRSLVAKLKIQLRLEEGFLYPELATLYGGADRQIERALENHAGIVRALAKVAGQIAKKLKTDKELRTSLAVLGEAVQQHLSFEEECFMPKLRRHMSTSAREELAEVFLDVKEEEQGSWGGGFDLAVGASH